MSRSSTRRLLALGFPLSGALLLSLSLAAASGLDRTPEIRRALDGGKARNVIFFLGDGMGDSEITIARNYLLGAGGRFDGIDALPLTGEATTWSVQEANSGKPDYVTDSAAAGTAWATGHKTSNGRISTTAGTNQDLKTILEIAREQGFATGNVSTAEITDATPAVLNAHVNDRGCQGPTDMANCQTDKKLNGGPGSIAEQTVDHRVDVILGGGKARFDQIIDGGTDTGKTVIQSAQRQGYQLVTTADQLASVSDGTRVLGLFASGNMTTEWSGSLAAPYPGSGPQRCVENNRATQTPDQPSLAAMTQKAIDLLDADRFDGKRRGNNGKGFFLQVEGASIDKRDHAEDPCGQIGETVAFDRAIQAGLAYAERHPNTLIIVTADHGHTSQIIDPQTAADHSPGAISTLITQEDVQMVVNYATNLHGRSQSHTGTEVRVAAQGPQAANVVGVIDQTDLFHLMARALGAE
jgi:alkaline phosphatase/streptomycin-6-phosphatase